MIYRMFHSCNEATHVNMILLVKQEQHDAANKVMSPNKPLWQGECTTKILVMCITLFCILSGERLSGS